MSEYLDALETRAPGERERDLMLRLPQLIALAQQAPGWQRILDDTVAADISSRAALAQLPVTRKSDLKNLQAQGLPFGGMTAIRPASACAGDKISCRGNWSVRHRKRRGKTLSRLHWWTNRWPCLP